LLIDRLAVELGTGQFAVAETGVGILHVARLATTTGGFTIDDYAGAEPLGTGLSQSRAGTTVAVVNGSAGTFWIATGQTLAAASIVIAGMGNALFARLDAPEQGTVDGPAAAAAIGDVAIPAAGALGTTVDVHAQAVFFSAGGGQPKGAVNIGTLDAHTKAGLLGVALQTVAAHGRSMAVALDACSLLSPTVQGGAIVEGLTDTGTVAIAPQTGSAGRARQPLHTCTVRLEANVVNGRGGVDFTGVGVTKAARLVLGQGIARVTDIDVLRGRSAAGSQGDNHGPCGGQRPSMSRRPGVSRQP
jgi:hypothetical protein